MKNKELSRLIVKLAKSDQKVRKLAEKDPSSWRAVERVDRKHLPMLKRLVEQFGWPTISLVGKRASHLAWMLVQHADRDVLFQARCLKLLKEAQRHQEATKTEVAFLTDRMLVNQGKPQLYGTQFHQDEKGELVPRPIRNIKELNKRRKEMGLGKFEDYRRQMERRWRSELAKRG